MFYHSFKNTFRVLLRQRVMIFWCLIFPIILGSFFKLALGNVYNAGKFEQIPVGVNEELLKDEYFKNFMDDLEKEKIFKVKEARDKSVLDEDEIVAYIEEEDKIFTKKSGISETLVEEILKSYVEKKDMIVRVMSSNRMADVSSLIINDNHIKDMSNPNMDFLNTYFYTLLGMQTIYGYQWGLYVIYQYEANLSTLAKRNSIMPLNKKKSLLSALFAAWIINFLITLFFIAILKLVFKVDFGGKIGPVMGLMTLSSLTGVSFGALLGASNKLSIEAKSGLGMAVTMLFCFLAGMMNMQIKAVITSKVPFINKVNPVALITDGIYSLYYYNSISRYANNMLWLGGLTVVLIIMSMFFMRGKQYESL